MEWTSSFRHHIAQRQKTAEQILRECHLDALVIDAGELHYYPEDDSTAVFRPYHHFAHWCPLPGESHLLLVRPGQKPVLHHFAPQDYWHEHAALGDSYWTSEFEIKPHASGAAVWAAALKDLKDVKHCGYIGPSRERAVAAGLKADTTGLLARLNWERSFKSEYEVKCTERATRRAAKGHVAAKEAFLAGGSELDIHLAFLRAIRGTEESLPYPTIVCLNEKGAVLHYHKKRDKVRNGQTFLIDAGTRYKGYASDITRSYAADSAPDVFRSLLLSMQKMQRGLCALIKPGVSYEFLHAKAHHDVGEILLAHAVLRGVSKDQVQEQGLTAPFFPHGLGHMLGIFVHDVAGKQLDRLGTPAPVNPKYEFLRTNRILDAGNLLTVEPGLYFIDMLLRPFRTGEHRLAFDWDLVDVLMRCGGIRVEDNVLVTRSGFRNLTREFLP